MRNNIIYLVVCGLLLIIQACQNYDDLIPTEFDKILSLKDVGEQNITLYNTGEDGVFSITVLKGGNLSSAPAGADLKVMNDVELAVYSETVGREYVALPTTLFELTNSNVAFAPDEKYQKIEIVFKTTAIYDLIHEDPTTNYVLPLMLTSATDSVNSEKDLVLFKPEVIIPSLNYEIGEETVDISGNSSIYKFHLVLPFESLWDFESIIEIDESSAPSGFTLLSNAQYSISDEGKVFFKIGQQQSEPLKIEIQNADLLGTNYVLPLKVTSTSMNGFEIPKTTFLLYASFNKIHLTDNMLSTNAQEPNEGPIENLIDNNPASYFHSAYSISIAEAHYFQINLTKAISKCSFEYQNRNNANGKPQDFKIMVSSNGSQWIELVHVNEGLPTAAGSKYSSAELNAAHPFSYFRFVVNRTNSGSAPTFFNMAEFSLCGK